MELLLPIALLGLMYVLLILPQQRRMKQHRQLLATLEVGDDVLTSAGIYGTVVAINEQDETIEVEVADGVILTMSSAAVSEVAVEEDDDPEGGEDEGPISD